MKKPKQRRVYERSENCSIVNTTISYNIKDSFENSILTFADSLSNYSGIVKRVLGEMYRRGIHTPEELFSSLPDKDYSHADNFVTSDIPTVSNIAVEEFDPVEAFM